MIAYSLRLWGQGIASKSLEIHSTVVKVCVGWFLGISTGIMGKNAIFNGG